MATTTLSINDIVAVTVTIEPTAAPLRNFGALLLLGSSSIIDATQRERTYTSITGVANDFGVNTPEYFGAAEFFAQSPQPAQITIGRWVQSKAYGQIVGGPQPSLTLATLTALGTCGFFFIAEGILPITFSINLSGATSLSNVASLITSAIQGATPNAYIVGQVTWNASVGNFVLTENSSTPTVGPSLASSPTAVGGFASSVTNATTATTVTLNGTVLTFVTGAPTGNQVQIGGSVNATWANLATTINSSTDPQVSKFKAITASANYGLNIYAATPGVAGNSLTVALSSWTSAVANASTLLGAVATDLSAPLALTAATGAYLVPVTLPETLLQCVQVHAALSNSWYCAILADQAVPQANDASHVAVAAYIEAASPSRIYGVNTQEAGALVSTSTTDLPSLLQSAGYMRTFSQYSSTSGYAVCSFFGRMATVDFTAQNSTLTAKFKLEPGIVAENLTETQAATLKSKNCNVFVNYQNGVAILQEGVMANGFFFDEVFNSDWFQNALQTAIYNLLYLSATKIPQTDAGVHQLVVTAMTVCSQAVYNGFIAPGTWTGNSFGQLRTGDNLPAGFYVYAPPVALQNLSDRAARKAPTLQIALKEAGAIHYSSTLVNVVR